MAADGAPGPTAWASTQVSAAPVIVANNDTQYGCYGVVSVYGYNFEPGSTVRIELLSGYLQTVMDTIYTIATGRGAVQYGIFTPPSR